MVHATAARATASSAAATGTHRWIHVPECLKVAASENVLSLSTLHQAVAALEKQPGAVTSAHVEALLDKVKGMSSVQFFFLYKIVMLE
jgi:hypothetical protein